VCVSTLPPTTYHLLRTPYPVHAGSVLAVSQRCVPCGLLALQRLMRAALRPVLVQVPCLAARVSPAACPRPLRSRQGPGPGFVIPRKTHPERALIPYPALLVAFIDRVLCSSTVTFALVLLSVVDGRARFAVTVTVTVTILLSRQQRQQHHTWLQYQPHRS